MARVFIETYGCSFNTSDAEAMAGILVRNGFQIVDTIKDADILIINTCTVKKRTQLEFQKRLKSLTSPDRQHSLAIVIAGCIPSADSQAKWLKSFAALGPDQIHSITQVVESALQSQPLHLIHSQNQTSLACRVDYPSQRRHPAIEILPIARGCMGTCTYCQTRLARGSLISFPSDAIIHRAERAINEGVRELWVTAQDTGAYGVDLAGVSLLPTLLRRLCAIEGDFRIRLGMTHPEWVIQSCSEWLDIFNHPKMFKFFHVPIQSGSEKVLDDMRRGYPGCIQKFIEFCQQTKKHIPELALLTDIIVGYPTEQDEDFEATLQLLNEIRPAATHRSRFSMRRGTIAANLQPLPTHLVAERSLRLNALAHACAREYHMQFIGSCGRVIVDELGKTIKNKPHVVAHNESYRPVSIEGKWPMGTILEVTYTDSTDFHLIAKQRLV